MINIKEKVFEKGPRNYKIKIEMRGDEAIKFIKEIGEFKQGEPRVWSSVTSRVFMVLSDALQDVNFIPIIPNRRKGDDSYPRLSNDNVWIEEDLQENHDYKDVRGLKNGEQN